MSNFNLSWIRDQFHLPADHAFFDNAGGSFTLRRVVERTACYMRETPIQLGASHDLSQRAAARQRDALESLARLIGADPRELVLGPSASSLTDRVARALQLRAGDEIVITDFDHEANISPWLRLRDRGVKVRVWRLDATTRSARTDDLAALLNPRTALIACTHCTNVLGEIIPIEDVVTLARETGAQVFVDGVAVAPHRRVDVVRLGVDYYVASLYKVFGPHIGLLYGRRERLLELNNINLAHMTAADVPYKLQPGGVPYELAYGAGGIGDYLEELGNGCPGEGDPLNRAWQQIADHEQRLAAHFVRGVEGLPAAELVGTASTAVDVRLPIFALRLSGVSARAAAEQLDPQGLCVRYGHFHARRLIDALGLDPADGVLRVSFAHYNTIEEVDRLLAALAEVKPRVR